MHIVVFLWRARPVKPEERGRDSQYIRPRSELLNIYDGHACFESADLSLTKAHPMADLFLGNSMSAVMGMRAVGPDDAAHVPTVQCVSHCVFFPEFDWHLGSGDEGWMLVISRPLT